MHTLLRERSSELSPKAGLSKFHWVMMNSIDAKCEGAQEKIVCNSGSLYLLIDPSLSYKK